METITGSWLKEHTVNISIKINQVCGHVFLGINNSWFASLNEIKYIYNLVFIPISGRAQPSFIACAIVPLDATVLFSSYKAILQAAELLRGYLPHSESTYTWLKSV